MLVGMVQYLVHASGGKPVQTVQTCGKPKVTPKVTFADLSRNVGHVIAHQNSSDITDVFGFAY